MKRNYLMFHTMAPEVAIEDLKEIYKEKKKMQQIRLTKDKLMEILEESKDSERMEFYYKAALEGRIEADQQMAIVGFLIMLVRYYHDKLFVDKSINPLDFFGLETINEQSEYWKFYELLSRTNIEIALCLISDENIPEKPLVEFSEVQAYTLFCFGSYLKCLGMCRNALVRDENSSICNFLKASIVDLCLINKTPLAYKIALVNYKKYLIDKCDSSTVGIDKEIFENASDEINSCVSSLGDAEKQIKFTMAADNFEETKRAIPEWTEEHDFYLRHNLFLNPLSNYEKFVESSIEELEELPIEKEQKDMFDEIIKDYKMCRNIAYSYYKGINNVGKREMCMAYSYAYSIYDKIAFLLMKTYNLNISEDGVGFTKSGLFDVKIGESNNSFKEIKNVNIVPLYMIMKAVREKNKISNEVQVGTFEHNELRNKIDHKSVLLVEEGRLRRNGTILLEQTRDAILYTFMLLHSCSKGVHFDEPAAISTTFFRAILKASMENR